MTQEESAQIVDYPANFTATYGKPYPQDNNYEYVSGGIINMVHEFMKTIRIYFDHETNSDVADNLAESQKYRDEIVQFLNSTNHVA